MDKLPIIDVEQTGKNIKELRKKCGLSAVELQDELGFASTSSIYHWECGYSLPTVDNLVILAAILKVRLDDILILKDEGE